MARNESSVKVNFFPQSIAQGLGLCIVMRLAKKMSYLEGFLESDWAVLNCGKRLPYDYVRSCRQCSFCVFAITSSTLYSCRNKNLTGDLQVEIVSVVYTIHSIYIQLF